MGEWTAPLSKATSSQKASSSLIYNNSNPARNPIPCFNPTGFAVKKKKFPIMGRS